MLAPGEMCFEGMGAVDCVGVLPASACPNTTLMFFLSPSSSSNLQSAAVSPRLAFYWHQQFQAKKHKQVTVNILGHPGHGRAREVVCLRTYFRFYEFERVPFLSV